MNYMYLLELATSVRRSSSIQFYYLILGRLLGWWERRNQTIWICWYINCSGHWKGKISILPDKCFKAIETHYIILLQGLMTPILRNADQKSISAISSEVLILIIRFILFVVIFWATFYFVVVEFDFCIILLFIFLSLLTSLFSLLTNNIRYNVISHGKYRLIILSLVLLWFLSSWFSKKSLVKCYFIKYSS